MGGQPREHSDEPPSGGHGDISGGVVSALQGAIVRARLFDTAPTVFVGRYVALRHLGRGGMGDVLVAYDPQLDRKVALKLLRSDALGDEEGRNRLVREAQAMARVAHPNVVTVHDVGVESSQVFIAMELVDGITLGRWLEQGHDWREALRVLVDVGRGVAAAHAVGLVHRDLKPDNVMIGHDGRVRVMDFGLARAFEGLPTEPDARDDAPSPDVPALALPLTMAGTIVGTPAYMSPEQLSRRPTSAASDQFSYCIVLWEALHGERPFRGETLGELAAAILEGRPSPPSRPPRFPEWLQKIVDRGLSVDPDRRFPSMNALLAAMQTGQARLRRRRLALAAAGVVALGLGLVGANAIAERRARQRCDDEAAAIAEVWNDDASARLREGLEATGVAHATDTWTRATPWIDRWASTWSNARATSCLAATVDDTMTADLYARATECFAERRTDLAALLAGFSTVEAKSVSLLVPAAAGLAAIEGCTDQTALLRRVPSDAGAEHAELRERLAHAQGTGLSGRYAEASAAAREIAEAAEHAGKAPLAADAWVVAGRNAEKAGDLDGSERALLRALELAGELGLDTVAADAATAMVYTVGVERQHADAGLAWGKAAAVFVHQLGDAEQMRGAALWSHMGAASWTGGDAGRAMELHRRALAIKQRILGERHPSVAITLLNLANAEEASRELEDAEAHYLAALSIFEGELGPMHPGVGSCANNLGHLMWKLGRHAEGISYYRRALDVKTATFGADHPAITSTLNNLGNAYGDLGDYEQAVAMHRRALEIRRASLDADHPDIATSLANLGRDLRLAGLVREALAAQTEALAIREKALGPDHADTLESMVLLARVRLQGGDDTGATELFVRAHAAAERKGPDHPIAGAALLGLGDIALRNESAAAAVPAYEKALAIFERTSPTPGHRAAAELALGRALWDAGGDRERAIDLVQRASDALDAPEDRDRRAEAQSWLALHPLRAAR